MIRMNGNLSGVLGSGDLSSSTDPRNSITRDEAIAIAADLHKTDALKYGGYFNEWLSWNQRYSEEFQEWLVDQVMEDYS